ncbi:MAG: hypothetical protein IPK73_01765 [Candidatus Obscuribacter sp.]|nr:hypothetical protein [Candidatus Obscuribacter sp.]
MKQTLKTNGSRRKGASRLTLLLVLGFTTLLTTPQSCAASNCESGRLCAPQTLAWFRRKPLPQEPPAPMPSPDNLVPPPSEEIYFPVRADGQPFLLNIDTTINLTDAISSFYYDPKWRGEVWAPFDQVSLIERSTRLMSTWPEYDQFSQYRIFNVINKKLEKYSGFGP